MGMMITFIVLLLSVTIGVIAYPLFFQKVTPHLSEKQTSKDFNEQDALLSALSELEEEYQMGRLSEDDYKRLKLHFQRRYLKTKRSQKEEAPETNA